MKPVLAKESEQAGGEGAPRPVRADALRHGLIERVLRNATHPLEVTPPLPACSGNIRRRGSDPPLCATWNGRYE